MGLLDQLSNLDPEQTQGLLAAASQMLQNSGPSRTPVGFGQIVGSGLEAYQGSTIAAKRRKMEEEQAALQKQVMGLTIRDKESDYANQEALRTRNSNLQDFTSKYFASQQQGPQAGIAAAPLEAASPDAQVPISAPASKASRFDTRMAFADALRAQGYNAEAEAEEKGALAFQPKVKNWQEVRQGGQVLYAPFFEDGTAGKPVPMELARKMEFRDTGGKTVGFDPFTGKVETSYQNTQSPNNVATVGAAYAQAGATRDIAKATRDAATIQRNQATEMKMADDYRAQSKGFKEVGDAYRTINSTLDKATLSPAATLASATKFMKLLDPGSVVRESELGMALAASGVFDRATNYYNTLLRGKVLTGAQVADFKNITKQIYSAAQQGQQDIDKSYRSQAEAYGLRPDMVVQDLGQNKPATPVRKYNPKTGKIE